MPGSRPDAGPEDGAGPQGANLLAHSAKHWAVRLHSYKDVTHSFAGIMPLVPLRVATVAMHLHQLLAALRLLDGPQIAKLSLLTYPVFVSGCPALFAATIK